MVGRNLPDSRDLILPSSKSLFSDIIAKNCRNVQKQTCNIRVFNKR